MESHLTYLGDTFEGISLLSDHSFNMTIDSFIVSLEIDIDYFLLLICHVSWLRLIMIMWWLLCAWRLLLSFYRVLFGDFPSFNWTWSGFFIIWWTCFFLRGDVLLVGIVSYFVSRHTSLTLDLLHYGKNSMSLFFLPMQYS